MSKFIIWGQPLCKYCDMSKRLLTLKNIDFEYKEIGSGYTKEDLLEAVPTARSVPQIFHDEVYIGGYEELARYLLR
jgi:glutaredoxin 3